MIRKKTLNYAVGINKKYIYNGLQTAITASGGFSIEENAKPMNLRVIENIAKYDVTDSVQLLFDVDTLNSKLGDYDMLNETFELNSIMIYASEFTHGLKSVEQINSVGKLENFYKDFVTYVNDFLNYEEGFSCLYLMDEEFEVEKEKMEISDLYETLIRKSENVYGEYNDLYGNITINGTNNILKYMKNLNIFGNRNGVVNPGFIEGDLIYVPYGLTISITVDLNAENLQLNKKGLEYVKKINEKNDYDNGNGSQETHTTSEKITRIVKIPLLMKLVNIPKPEHIVTVETVSVETVSVETVSIETVSTTGHTGPTDKVSTTGPTDKVSTTCHTDKVSTGPTGTTDKVSTTGPTDKVSTTGPTDKVSTTNIISVGTESIIKQKQNVPKILRNIPVVKKQTAKPLIQHIKPSPEITKPVKQEIKPLQKENNVKKPPSPSIKSSVVAPTSKMQLKQKPVEKPIEKSITKNPSSAVKKPETKNVSTRKTSPKRITIASSTGFTRKISQTGNTGTIVKSEVKSITGPTGPTGPIETNKLISIINGPTGIEMPKNLPKIVPKPIIENIFIENKLPEQKQKQKPEPQPEPEPKPQPEPQPEPEPKPQPETKPEQKQKPEQEPVLSDFLEEKQIINKQYPQPEPQQEEYTQEKQPVEKKKIHIVSNNLNIYKKQLKLKRTDITNLFKKK
jgi:hypothetical protein